MSRTASKAFADLQFKYPNEREFDILYEEIFKKHTYYVDLDFSTPRIIDGGAYIGLTTLYYKSIFPNAQITAFEPHPTAVKFFKQNMFANQFDDVELIEKALWKDEGTVEFFIDAQSDNNWLSTSSFTEGSWKMNQETKAIQVACTQLSQYLTWPIDILKLDIEGAETTVIEEAYHTLENVRHVLIEFHANRLHRPEYMLKLLQKAGFELTAYYDHSEISLDKLTHRKPSLYLIEGVNKKHR